VADAQSFANLFAGQSVHQVRGDFAFAGGEFGLDGFAGREVFKGPDARFVRRVPVERSSRHMAPEGFAFEAAVHPFHDAVVGIHAFGVQDGRDALAGAFVFVDAGVEQLKTLADELLAAHAKHLANALVAVNDGAVAREHQADGGQIKGESVIDV
jgi:hypothetical protein